MSYFKKIDSQAKPLSRGLWQSTVILLFLATPAVADSTPQAVNPEPAGPYGETPYEIVWAERAESEHVQVAFDDLSGWTLAVDGDAKVSAFASGEKRIWRDSVLCLTYAGGNKPTSATLRPPNPIRLNGRVDQVRLWVYGGFYRHPGATGDKTVPEIAVLLTDRNNQEIVVDLGKVTHGGWTIAPGQLSAAETKALEYPLRFNGIRVSGLESEGNSRMFFESLEFFKPRRNPSAYPFKPLNPEVIADLDRGILPTPPEDVSTVFDQVSSDTIRFTSTAATGSVVYEIKPSNGFFNGIRVQSDSESPWFKPVDGGGLLPIGSNNPLMTGEGLDVQVKANHDRLIAVYTGDDIRFRVTYQLLGRTLAVDVVVEKGDADGLDLGRVSELPEGRAVFVPYLAYSRVSHLTTNGPAIAVGRDLFVSVLPDLFNSDFSSVVNDAEFDTQESFRVFTSTKYMPLTDGQRLPLRDRILITAAPEFQEVLPSPITSPSPNLDALKSSMYVMTYTYHLDFYKTLADFGLKNILANHHFSTFLGPDADGLASFSNRWRPRPEIGLENWTEYGDAIRDLDYRFGTYTFFPNIHPLSEHWDENRIALRYNGALHPGWWYGEYAIKLNSAAEMVRYVGQHASETYKPDATYLDIHSVMGPSAMDYEAGADGAGLARSAVLANLDAIAEVRNWYGITSGEGYHRWLFAGASDINFASMLHPKSYASASEVAPLVDFDLLKIHPREAGLMMSFQPQYFLKTGGPEVQALLDEDGTGEPPIGFYHYVATSLAFGHMAGVGYDYVPPVSRIIQIYALMISPQRRYLASDVQSIAYHDGENYLNTSDALRVGAIAESRRVRVTYEGGLTVYANLSDSDNWTVQDEIGDFVLPPYGWLAATDTQVVSASVLVDGQRVDAAQDDDYLYMRSEVSSGLAEIPTMPMKVDGSLWSVREDDGSWVVWAGDDLGVWTRATVPGWPNDITDRVLQRPDTNAIETQIEIAPERLFEDATSVRLVATQDPIVLTPDQKSDPAKKSRVIPIQSTPWIELPPGYASYRLIPQ